MGGCECGICKNDRGFDVPPHLLEELKLGRVIVFAGAGISTENPEQAADTFYATISHELGLTEKLPFPEVMQRYCDQPDGRIKLITKIKERFSYFRAFSDFYKPMTPFSPGYLAIVHDPGYRNNKLGRFL